MSLPKYRVVRNDGSQDYKDTVIKYLNEQIWGYWCWFDLSFYWFDWNKAYNWSNTYYDINDFENNPTLLTLTQFKQMREEFTEWEEVYISSDSVDEAIKNKGTRTYLNTVKNINICVFLWDEDSYENWKPFDVTARWYIAKIPKEEEMTLKDICKELWRDIKIVK